MKGMNKIKTPCNFRLTCAVCLILICCGFPPTGVHAGGPPKGTVARPRSETGIVVTPDRFLRRWDPITVFFDSDIGKPSGTSEDHPEQWFRMEPSHPGAFEWLDRKTIQFRPADPWPPLSEFTITTGKQSMPLFSLMPAPVKTIPKNGKNNLRPVETIVLEFPDPIDPAFLYKMVSIEVRPLPGVSDERVQHLGENDFTVKMLERKAPESPVIYEIRLKKKIVSGYQVTVLLKLSLDDSFKNAFMRVRFSTAPPFRLVSAGSARIQLPLTPQGTRYTKEQAVECETERAILLHFSEVPEKTGPTLWRNFIRFTPLVKNITYQATGKFLKISGEFEWDMLYQAAIHPMDFRDKNGRKLDMKGESAFWFYFPPRPDYLKWNAGHGIVELHGPKMVPIEGRGMNRVDLRIYPLDPLNRNLWPFPKRPVTIDESKRPPGPGEEPGEHSNSKRFVSTRTIRQNLKTLGSPPVSVIADLPLKQKGSGAAFGFDLSPYLERLSGKNQPGTYLVGFRPVDESKTRHFMRIQVTDLCLSTFEEPNRVKFLVTSISDGSPVSDAEIRLEGAFRKRGSPWKWITILKGKTDPHGMFTWDVTPLPMDEAFHLKRIVVKKSNDFLVLNPENPPAKFRDNQWMHPGTVWLQWAFKNLKYRSERPRRLCHIFTDRPVYRPEEAVHIKGYLRQRFRGKLTPIQSEKGWIVVRAPGGLEWRYEVKTTEMGSFYHKFSESNLPTGEFSVHIETPAFTYPGTYFRMEAYRIPKFEVRLHGPDITPLDRPFDVTLTSEYYAGGHASDLPIRWRVTQYPYTWIPKTRPGFRFSTDSRFSQSGRFRASPKREEVGKTDENGSAVIRLDPGIEPTAQPRTYVVEATVTGKDDQTVTDTKQIKALPPFVLGLKMPSFVEWALGTNVEAEVIAVMPDGKLLEGKEISLRLFNRQWHSVLRERDFTSGKPSYATDIVDEKIFETRFSTGSAPVKITLPVDRAGVYIVELSATDDLGRSQTVKSDFFAGGRESVAWPRPGRKVFNVTKDKDKYNPGENALLVLQSPFQKARAIAVVEAPEGNRYEGLFIENGSATFTVPLKSTFTPRIPVHFLLWRGRIPGVVPVSGSGFDPGKPATMATTVWLKVNPVGNRVNVELEYPEKALPGKTVSIRIKLSEPVEKRPLSGEVTLWLVDQAVLALGRELPLDPVPAFIDPVYTRLSLHDTRNLPFGMIPFSEIPGGEAAAPGKGPLDKVTVRKKIVPVPYFNPDIVVGPGGEATVEVKLPDNLTNFKIRAKAISGDERFGYAKGMISVRLPVIVQPALPRFARPGDRFTAAALGRVVEGDGGPGTAEIRIEGAELIGEAKRDLLWTPNRPERIDFDVRIPKTACAQNVQKDCGTADFLVGVNRKSDGAGDAFEIKLPIMNDRRRVTYRMLKDLDPGDQLNVPAFREKARPGSFRRSLKISDRPGLVRMAAGLDFLMKYPYGCTEQRLSITRTMIAFSKFRNLLHAGGSDPDLKKSVKDLNEWLSASIDPYGLCAYWPGSTGYVGLTALAVLYQVEAKKAGFSIDEKVHQRFRDALKKSLRSDYTRFIDGEAWAERCWALTALTAAGTFDPSYAEELSVKAQFLGLEGVSHVLMAFADADRKSSPLVAPLLKELRSGVVLRKFQGKEIYGGLRETTEARSRLVLPSETRTLAEMVRVIRKLDHTDKMFDILVQALVTLGRDDGWGTTNANSAALLAFSEILDTISSGKPDRSVTLTVAGRKETIPLGNRTPMAYLDLKENESVVVKLKKNDSPLFIWAETSYIPEADGSMEEAVSNGFVVSRSAGVLMPDGAPSEKRTIDEKGTLLHLSVGQIIEDHVQVVNPKNRHFVAVTVPLSAGMEPLNPNLETASADAKPSGRITMEPTYSAYLDDSVAFYYNELPKGVYDFYFRTRASVPGTFIQPAATAQMMYNEAVFGNSFGAKMVIERKK